MIINPKKAIDEGWIENFDLKNIHPNGIDVRIESIQVVPSFGYIKSFILKEKILPDYRSLQYNYTFNSWILDKQYPFYLINCIEKVQLPATVCAMVIKRSTINRVGWVLQSALWDSGFKGRVGFTVCPNQIPMIVEPNDRMAQVVFMEAEDSGVLYEGTYQNQEEH